MPLYSYHDNLLSYYESSIPNEYRTRSSSGGSSSSAYSTSNTPATDQDLNSPAGDTSSESSPSVTKRLATPSKGGADRRRLAIVQLDSPSSIRERRGYKNDLSGLALIAPPDAASHTYTHLTPPSTAPLTGDMFSRGLKTAAQDAKTHHRSASDIPQLVNTRPTTMAASKLSRTARAQDKNTEIDNDTTRPPTLPPKTSASISKSKSADQAHSTPYILNTLDFGSPISTPQIGEAKNIHVPVAAPVVMNLENVAQTRTTTPRPESPASSTACGHGQSAMSQTMIDDHKPTTPGPSRFQSSGKNVDSEAGQGPQTRGVGVAALRSAKINQVKASNDIGVQDSSVGQTNLLIHRREAATVSEELDSHVPRKASPNLDLTLEEITPSRPEGPVEPISPQYRILPPTPVAKPLPSTASPPKIDHSKFDQWLEGNPQFTPRGLRRGASLDEPRRYGLDPPKSPLSAADHVNAEPPEPPLKGLRHSITTTVKRFSSISRAASLSSKSTHRSNRSSQETRRSSRTPSPLPNYSTRTPSLNSHKVISMNPAALFCHEIGGQTTTLQRCYIYANKINELSMYDCGLSNWVVQMKDQSSVPQRQRGLSSKLFVPKPRHTSRSSVISEATFPRRLDATTATDLSPGQFDDVGSIPRLPYPSLARRTVPARSNTSTSSTSPPTSLRSLTPSFSTSGFFAALGRKASLSKRDRTPILSTRITAPGVAPSGARFPPAKTNQSIQPRPIQITSPPTIPGGPRAPPSRSKRAHRYMSRMSFPSPEGDCDDNSPRSPSVIDTPTLDNVIDIKPDPEFTKQVDQLVALIPQADPNILAGYLRREGSDMQAIGQYLEDERMGVVRSH